MSAFPFIFYTNFLPGIMELAKLFCGSHFYSALVYSWVSLMNGFTYYFHFLDHYSFMQHIHSFGKNFKQKCFAMLRIRDVYPGLWFFHSGSNNNKRGRGNNKICSLTHFVAVNFTELKIIWTVTEKNLIPFDQEVK